MKVRIVHPENAAGLIDPDTQRRPFIDAETGSVVLEATVPDTSFWQRRLIDREIGLVTGEPTGREPVTPLTTR